MNKTRQIKQLLKAQQLLKGIEKRKQKE